MSKKEKIGGDLIAGGMMICLASFILHQASSFSPGAAKFPRFLSLLLLGLSVLFILSTLWKFAKSRKIINSGTEAFASRSKFSLEFYPFIIIILCILFISILNKIGFELSACCLILATMAIIDRKQVKRSFYLAFLFPAVLILIFKFGIGLRIPLLFQKLIEYNLF